MYHTHCVNESSAKNFLAQKSFAQKYFVKICLLFLLAIQTKFPLLQMID